LNVRFTNPTIRVPEEEVRVIVGSDFAGGRGFDDFLYFDGYEVVEGVDMLAH